MTTFAELTTMRVGGPVTRLVTAAGTEDLIEAGRSFGSQEDVLVVSGGSNLLVSDDGFAGTTVLVRSTGYRVEDSSDCAGVTVRVAAGTPWDEFVAVAVDNGWSGVEALSGIPGQVGAGPIQNVGAYGQEVSETIAQVRTWDRVAGEVRTFARADCAFGYRDSRFKREPGRYLVLEVVFQLRLTDHSAPVKYAELARRLEVEVGQRAPSAEVRAAVLELRRGKGMVLDAQDHDTWSCGSFFTNPILPADFDLPADAPRFPAGPGQVKTSAAWLIDHAGFGKGFGLPGPVALSTKHVLALTNRGEGRAVDVVALARRIRDGVQDRFGVRLVNEPVFVGLQL